MRGMALYDYQRDMVARIERAYESHRSVMAQMPTGTGKTMVLATVVSSFMESKCGGVWILAHRRELVMQITDTVNRVFPKKLLTNSSRIKVMSVQWLSLHYHEIEGGPSLIVFDEAHHAVASTYAEVIRAFPTAKILGLTATPYRLDGRGFSDLFDVLLTSWTMERFIANGRLSLYDYYSIVPESEDQLKVDSLSKRGADGDYQLKELAEVMDVRPTLERLCQSVMRFVPGKKGIVYAFSIAHAEHIAAFYREHGINAVAVSSKTPNALRRELLERFSETSVDSEHPKIQVLVSVDLFSEGFDCPDVEFIQLARPTLSLSKYLQMVGRGLRVTRGKKYCVILDNVGLYRRFGLPSADHDWQRMFLGKCRLAGELQEACMRINGNHGWAMDLHDDGGLMMKVVGHGSQRKAFGEVGDFDFHKVETDDGKTIWQDGKSGLHFSSRPQCVMLRNIEFCTADGKRFYPRLRSKFIDDSAYVNIKTLELQVGSGINWKRRLILWQEPYKVYHLTDKCGSVRLYEDDNGDCFAQGNPDMPLTKVTSQEEMNAYCRLYSEREKAALRLWGKRYKHGLLYPVREPKALSLEGVRKEENDVWRIDGDAFGESYWADGLTGMKHYSKPESLRRGFVSMLREKDWYYVRNIPGLADKHLRNWQIVADDNICVIDSQYLFLKQEPRLWFKILRRTDDFSYFVVRRCDIASPHLLQSDITITQYGGEGMRMECNGVPYLPRYQAVGRL